MKHAKLGDKAKCKVSGFTGVVVAETRWLNGCIRITLQPPAKNDGTLPASETFDVGQIEIVKAMAVRPAPSDDGGPIKSPRQHPGLDR